MVSRMFSSFSINCASPRSSSPCLTRLMSCLISLVSVVWMSSLFFIGGDRADPMPGKTNAEESFRRNGSHSLASQSDQRINFRRPPRRNPAGQQGAPQQQQGNGAKGQRVVRTHAKQQALHQAGQRQRSQQPNPYANSGQAYSFLEHQPDDIRLLRSERYPNADFARPRRHAVGHYTVKANRREQCRQDAEEAGERGDQPILRQRFIQLSLEGRYVEDRQVFVQFLKYLPDSGGQRSGAVRSAHIQRRHPGPVALEEREVNRTLSFFSEALVLSRFDHADDLEFADVRGANHNAPTQRTHPAEEIVRHGFVNDGGLGRALLIGKREVASGQQWDAQALEETRTDSIHDDVVRPFSLGLGFGDGNRRGVFTPAKRAGFDEASRPHIR